MSISINKAIIIGNLGKDPEMRQLEDGTRIANLSVATSEKWKDKVTGEAKEYTEWHHVVIFNERIAEFAAKYLKKGARVYVEGKIQTHKWTDKDGIDRFKTEIFLSKYKGELVILESLKKNEDHEIDGNKAIPFGGSDTVFNDDNIPF